MAINPLFKPKSEPHDVTVDGKTITIWGDKASMDAIFPDATVVVRPAGKLITVNQKARTCKRYPGDTGWYCKARVLQRYDRVNPKGGGALPGLAFTAQFTGDIANGDPSIGRVFNFRLQGAWKDLITYAASGDTSLETTYFSPSGHPTVLNAGAAFAAQPQVFESGFGPY